MAIKDKILERLRRGEPLSEIRKEHKSVSKTYEALRQFLDESDKIVDERQRSLEDLRNAQAEEEKRLIQTKQERVKISQENDELTKLNEKMDEEVMRKTVELHRLNDNLDELSKRGYSPELLREIGKIEARSGRKLLKQLRTVEKFNQTKKEFRSLKRRKGIVEREFHEIQIEKTEIQKAVVSEGNRLDELKIQGAAHEEAVEVVKDFKRDGYSAEDLRVLKSCLDTLQIKDDPKLSISRLARGLEMQKSLTILKDHVEKERKNFRKFEKAKTEAKDESEILKQTTIGTIETARNAGLEAINQIVENAKTAILDAAKKFETITDGHLRRCEDHFQRNMEKVNAASQEYAEFQKEKSRFEETVYPMMLLLGSKDPQLLDQVPILFVAEVLNRVLVWVILKAPEATVVPSQYIQTKDPFLFSGPHKISHLLELASEGLKQQMIEMTQTSKI